jgi:hypothetical protein
MDSTALSDNTSLRSLEISYRVVSAGRTLLQGERAQGVNEIEPGAKLIGIQVERKKLMDERGTGRQVLKVVISEFKIGEQRHRVEEHKYLLPLCYNFWGLG